MHRPHGARAHGRPHSGRRGVGFGCRGATRTAGAALALALLLALLLAPLATAAGRDAPDGPIALDVEELDAATLARIGLRFELDRLALDLLGAAHVPGMVVVVSIGGETVAAEAYGTADRASGRGLTLDDPLWVGPLTRTLTAIVTLDLVADGRVSLDDPVVGWLPELDARSGAFGGVTMAHLLAESAGIGARRASLRGGALPPGLDDVLPPAGPPGERVGACPACTALLGLVVERASREDVGRAVARRLATPLRLATTRIGRGPSDAAPEDGAAPPARRHVHAPGGLLPIDDDAAPPPPGSGALMSGRDAERLLGALTRPEPGPPLDRGVREALLATADRSHPAVGGGTLGMAEATVLGHDALVQGDPTPGGGAAGASSLLVVVPTGAVGVFVHVNGDRSPGARIATADGVVDPAWAMAERVVELVLGDARVPPRSPATQNPVHAAEAASAETDGRSPQGDPALVPVPGPYRPATLATGLDRLRAPSWWRESRLAVEGDVLTILHPPAVSAPRSYVLEAPGVYRRALGGEALATVRDAAGRPVVHTSMVGPVTYALVPVLERTPVVAGTIGAFALLATLVLLSWPVGAYRRWRRKDPRGDDPKPGLVRLRALGRLAAAAGLLALAAALVAAAAAVGWSAPTLTWLPLAIRAAVAVAGAAALALAASTVLAVAGGAVDGRAGALHAALAAATFGLLAQVWTWQLLA